MSVLKKVLSLIGKRKGSKELAQMANVSTNVQRKSNKATNSVKRMLLRNFAPSSLATTHKALFKDPAGAVQAYFDLPTQRALGYYKNLEKGHLTDWAKEMQGYTASKIKKNAPTLEALKDNWGKKDYLSSLKNVGTLAKDNPMSTAMSALGAYYLPGMIVDPLKEVAQGDAGLFEGLGSAASNVIGSTAAGPILGTIAAWGPRDSLARMGGRGIDSVLGTNSEQNKRKELEEMLRRKQELEMVLSQYSKYLG